jgi:hypothetical protein
MNDVWEEEEIHCRARTYHDVIFKRRDKPMRRLEDEKQAREAQNKNEEEETKKETIKTSEETTIEKEKKENQQKILNHKRI